ncbi:MAG TPA: hypothetical protein RMH99_22580 [Sandaracinaceae bacterium LLY-WYZ-13_1]|nr:hypothetical protein [Sandaracinaceae bacterium LLY-WYZ-13_1]
MFDGRIHGRLAAPTLVGAAALLGLLVGGCGSRVGYGVRATAYTPGMVAVDSGVWAVTGYPDPIFWGGDDYWMYRDGYWHRSAYLGGWNRVGFGVVPPRIRHIDRPYRYRRYVAPRRARVRRVPRGHYRPRVYRPSRRRGQVRRRGHRVRRPPAARRRGPAVRRPGPRGRVRGRGRPRVRRPR